MGCIIQLDKRELTKGCDCMKRFVSVIMLLACIITLCACANTEQSEPAIYSFYGKNEEVEISNGVISLTDAQNVFYGGILKFSNTDMLEEMVSYCATFYTIIDGEKTPIHIDEVKNASDADLLNIDLGKITDTNLSIAEAFEKMEELQAYFWCDIEITYSNNESKTYNVPLVLIDILE